MYKLAFLGILLAPTIATQAMIEQLLAIEQRVLGQDLIQAAWSGDEARMKALIHTGIDINCLDFSGLTPFDYANSRKHQNICRLLAMTHILRNFRTAAPDSYERMFCMMNCYNRISKTLTIPIPRTAVKILIFHSEELALEIIYGAFYKSRTYQDFLRRATAMLGLQKTTKLLSKIIKTMLLRFFEATAQNHIKDLVEDYSKDILAQILDDDSLEITTCPLIPKWALTYCKGNHSTIKTLATAMTLPKASTPLIRAVEFGTKIHLAYLIKRGADCNEKDALGFTPLTIAVRLNKMKAITILLQCGAKLNSQDNQGMTPFHVAAMCGHLDIVDFLLKNLPEINVRDYSGATPFHLAAHYDRQEVLTFLLSRGALIDSYDYYERRAIHWAALNNKMNCVSFLLARGATCPEKGTLSCDEDITDDQQLLFPFDKNNPNRALLLYACSVGQKEVCHITLRAICYRIARENALQYSRTVITLLCCFKKLKQGMIVAIPKDVVKLIIYYATADPKGNVFGAAPLLSQSFCESIKWVSLLTHSEKEGIISLSKFLGPKLELFLAWQSPIIERASEVALYNGHQELAYLTNHTTITERLSELIGFWLEELAYI